MKDSPEPRSTRNAAIGQAFDELEVGMVVHPTRTTAEARWARGQAP